MLFSLLKIKYNEDKGVRNMEKEFNEKDWKLFRKKLPEWQSSYIKN